MNILNSRPLQLSIIVLAGMIVYMNSLTKTFYWEDEVLVTQNVHIRKPANIPVFFNPGYVNVYEAGLGQRYRPLRTVSFVLDYMLWKDNPIGYHFTNLLLHLAASVLVWKFLRVITGNSLASFAGAVLFSVHPVHVESVEYVKNRSDILCAIFYMLAFIAFAKICQNLNPYYYVLSIVSALLAFVSKEMAMVIPIVMTGFIVFLKLSGKSDATWRKLNILTLPYYAILIGYLFFKHYVMKSGYGYDLVKITLIKHIAMVINTVSEYIKVMAFPLNLSLERTLPDTTIATVFSFILLVLIGVVFLYAILKKRYILAFMIFFLVVSMAPVSNIVILVGRAFAEQRAYIPSIGFVGILSYGFMELEQSKLRVAVFILTVILIVLFSSRTVIRNLDWKDEVLLWTKTTMSSPSSFRAYNNLAVTLQRRGDYAGAIENANKSLSLSPSFIDAYNTLGSVYYKLGLYEKSIIAYEKGLVFSEGRNPVILMNLATLYSLTGKDNEAMQAYRKAIAISPWSDAAYYNMALTLSKTGKDEEAIKALNEAISLNPYNIQAYMKLAELMLNNNNNNETAKKIYQKVLSLDKNNIYAMNGIQNIDNNRRPQNLPPHLNPLPRGERKPEGQVRVK